MWIAAPEYDITSYQFSAKWSTICMSWTNIILCIRRLATLVRRWSITNRNTPKPHMVISGTLRDISFPWFRARISSTDVIVITFRAYNYTMTNGYREWELLGRAMAAWYPPYGAIISARGSFTVHSLSSLLLRPLEHWGRHEPASEWVLPWYDVVLITDPRQ